MKGEGSSVRWSGEELGAKEIGPEIGMTGCKVRSRRMSWAGTSFGSKLVGVDMEEVKMSTFEGRNVVQPGVGGRMSVGGDG